jgi:hypothetical protein
MMTVRAAFGVLTAPAEWNSFVDGLAHPQWLLPAPDQNAEMTLRMNEPAMSS